MTYQEFSSVLKRAPDADQEKVIRSLQNTIVSAGAGSGKTQTLASRFVYLIAADLQDENGKPLKNPTVDRILTLTFTKKAAAEMYQRIYQTLKTFSEKAPDPKGRERAKSALENFSKARIQTLDSYSASILRQAAPLYGIRPDFTAGADSLQTKDLAFSFVMENRNNPAEQWISSPARLEECAELFAAAANLNASIVDSINKEKKCKVFAQSLQAQKKAVQEKWLSSENPLAQVEDTIEEIKSRFPPEGKSKGQWIEKTAKALDLWEQAATKKARDFIRAFPADKDLFKDAQRLADFADSKECYAVQKALDAFEFTNEINDPETRGLIKDVLFGADKSSAGQVNILRGALSFFSDIKHLEGLHPLLDELTDKINDSKRKTGELTFKDIAELALLVLKEQDAIRKQERDAFDFIMIDEFQDNNAANRDLLLLISKDDSGKLMKNRLFFVGDEKQSIYKFRGADVSVFNSLQDYIAPCVLLPMRRNYRSSNILLDEFNQIFGGFLPDDNEKPSVVLDHAKIFKETSGAPYEAKFDQSARAIFPETKEKENKSGARIQVCFFSNKGLDPDQNLEEKDAKAFCIAQKIIKLRQEQNIPFKKIALLVKSRTNYSNIARIFSLNKIPFSLDLQGNIFTQATANDFYNILRLCVYPSDKNAYASFLTSPFTGMTLEDAEKILSLFPQKAFDPQAQVQSVLDAAAFKRWQAAEAFFKDFAQFALSRPIADSMKRLWQDEGYKFSPAAQEEHYDLLYELAREADAQAKDLSWFVDQLAVEKGDSFNEDSEINVKETNYPVENPDAVNVMTIHKSKGLQFDYVFVWGIAETRGGNGGAKSKIFKSDQFGAVVANQGRKQNLFAVMAQSENAQKENAEFRRLIYVALTRAIKGLYVIASRPSSSDSEKPFIKLALAYEGGGSSKKSAAPESQSLPPAPFEIEDIPPYLRGSERPEGGGQTRSAAAIAQACKSARLVAADPAQNIWTSPSALEENDETGLAGISTAYPEINSFVNDSALAKKDYGTLFHSFMENWSRSHLTWTRENVNAKEYFDRNPLVRKISAENKEILLDVFFKILEKFLNQKDNAALQALASGRAFKAECGFKTKVKSFIISGSMDAVFQNADGSWTVLDYKTDLAERPQIYYNQLACYKKAAADLFADGDQSKVHCLLFYAESGRFCEISQEAQKALESLTDEKIRNLIEK